MSLERIVEHFKKTDLSGDDIETLVGKPVVLYSDLGKYKSITQLLGKEKYVVILYQTSSYTSGHYIAITQNDSGKIRYCDSYGIKNPLTELQFTPYDKVLPKYLDKLLGGIDYESNTTDYQSKTPTISTCGRWASLFCKFRNLTLVQIRELFTANKSAYLNDSDNASVLLTLLALKDITSYLDDIPRGYRPV